MQYVENCWPTPADRLLLEACLKETRQAQKAWEEYLQLVDLKSVSFASSAFFPLVYKKLYKTPVEGLDLCKSMYQYVWSANHLLLFQLTEVLNKLHQVGIPSYLLKGTALIDSYYADAAFRKLGDIDLLVSRENIPRALQILETLGFKPDNPVDLRLSHAAPLTSQDDHSIDLHWEVLTESWLDARLRRFSFRTQPSALFPTALLFGPEDLLIHTLFHGLRHSETPLIRWIPDAVHILRKSPQMDWDYFLAQASLLEMQPMIHSALSYLSQYEFASFPLQILEKLRPWKPRSQKYFAFLAQDSKKPFAGLKMYWHIHLRNSPSDNLFVLLMRFLPFIKKSRPHESWLQLTTFLMKKLCTHTRKLWNKSLLGLRCAEK